MLLYYWYSLNPNSVLLMISNPTSSLPACMSNYFIHRWVSCELADSLALVHCFVLPSIPCAYAYLFYLAWILCIWVKVWPTYVHVMSLWSLSLSLSLSPLSHQHCPLRKERGLGRDLKHKAHLIVDYFCPLMPFAFDVRISTESWIKI
jgi:hypothetical protein